VPVYLNTDIEKAGANMNHNKFTGRKVKGEIQPTTGQESPDGK